MLNSRLRCHRSRSTRRSVPCSSCSARPRNQKKWVPFSKQTSSMPAHMNQLSHEAMASLDRYIGTMESRGAVLRPRPSHPGRRTPISSAPHAGQPPRVPRAARCSRIDPYSCNHSVQQQANGCGVAVELKGSDIVRRARPRRQSSDSLFVCTFLILIGAAAGHVVGAA